MSATPLGDIAEAPLGASGGILAIMLHKLRRRQARLALIGEGTAEIQKMIVGRRLLERYKVADG